MSLLASNSEYRHEVVLNGKTGYLNDAELAPYTSGRAVLQITVSGEICWRVGGRYESVDGLPSFRNKDGAHKYWHSAGQRHNEAGQALTYNGVNSYYLGGMGLDEETWKKKAPVWKLMNKEERAAWVVHGIYPEYDPVCNCLRWVNAAGELHSSYGLYAIRHLAPDSEGGYTAWYRNGKLHREDGFALSTEKTYYNLDGWILTANEFSWALKHSLDVSYSGATGITFRDTRGSYTILLGPP